MQHLLGDFDYTIEATPEQKFNVSITDGVFRDPEKGLVAFTDGSKDGERVGSGLVVFFEGMLIFEEAVRLSGQCSVFQAELQAILLAARFFNARPPEDSYHIFSDSQAALRALETDEVSSQLVLDTIKELNLLDDVSLGWVRGHRDCRGNILADGLAKEASLQQDVAFDLPLPRYEIIQQVLGWVRTQWDREWAEYPLARQTKAFFPTTNKKQSLEVMQLSRKKLGRQNQNGDWTQLLAYALSLH